MVRKWYCLIIMVGMWLSTSAGAYAHPLDTGSSTLTFEGSSVNYELYLPNPMLGRYDSNHDGNVTLEELNSQRVQLEQYLSEKLWLEANETKLSFSLLTVKAKSTPSSSGFAMTMRFGSKSSFEGVYLHYNLLFDDLTPNHTNITVIPYGDQFDQLVFDSGNRVHFYEPHVPPSAWKMASTYFVLGVKHILEGYDHLLFLFSLLLVSATIGSSVKLVTGFTIAHSITLLLTASGYLPVTPAWVETFIAASICYVAIENMVRKNMNNRWVVTFLFGLVHGMGFAGALSETGLPTVHFIKSLLSFNLGIEFGQVGIIFVVLPLLLTLRQYNWFPRLCGGLSCVILLIACYWLVERVSQGGFIGAG